MKLSLAYIESNQQRVADFVALYGDYYSVTVFETAIAFYNWYLKSEVSCDVILSSGDINSPEGVGFFNAIRVLPKFERSVFLLASEQFSYADKKLAVSAGLIGIFLHSDLLTTEFSSVVESLIRQKDKREANFQKIAKYKTPKGKRIFDFVFSFLAILFLSPVMFIIALLIVIQDGFPIVYASKRVGAGYQIFNFYKFRTMIKNADQKIDSLKHLNQYGKAKIMTSEFVQCDDCISQGIACQSKLFMDTGIVCEKIHLLNKRQDSNSTFVKISDDPRITKLGAFLRNTSLDELPQLFNVLFGCMSLVGNRPLPLYEAEGLTSDQMIKRFMAPAGITGAWQVSKRGKAEMSAEERQQLDNNYAENFSLLTDLTILLKTIPALIQKDNV